MFQQAEVGGGRQGGRESAEGLKGGAATESSTDRQVGRQEQWPMHATNEPALHCEALCPQPLKCNSSPEALFSLGLLKPFGGFHFAIFDFSFQTNIKPCIVTTSSFS